MEIKKIFAGLGIILCILVLAACGGGATPPPHTTAANKPPPAPTQESEPTTSADSLATDVAIVQNPPTLEPKRSITASPEVVVTRKFHFGSLNGMVKGW